MPKSRSNREEQRAGAKRADAAFKLLSPRDRSSALVDAGALMRGAGKTADEFLRDVPGARSGMRESVQRRAGKPGAYTTGPGEDIQVKRKKR